MKFEKLGGRAVFLLLLLSLVIHAVIANAFVYSTADDAYISLRYSKHMAEGHGIVWNIGDQPTQGFTSMLWTLVGAALFSFNLDAVILTKYLAILLNLCSIVLVHYFGKNFFELDGIASAVPPLVLAFTCPIAVWGVHGFETSLFIFILMSALYAVSTSLKTGESFYLSGILLFLLVLTRPEGYVVLLSTFAFLMYFHFKKEVKLADILKWGFVFLVLFVPYFILQWSYFGYPLPAPFYVKVVTWGASYLKQILYVVLFLTFAAPYVVLSAYSLAHERISREKQYLLFAMTMFLVAYFFVYPAMGHFYRFLLPVFPILILFSSMLLKSFRIKMKLDLNMVFSVFLILFLILYPFHTILQARDYADGYSKGGQRFRAVAGWLSQFPDNVSISISDIGYLPYVTDLRTADLSGLTDYYVAQNGLDAEYIVEVKKPDIVFLNSEKKDEYYINPARTLSKIDPVLYESGLFHKNYHFAGVFDGSIYYYHVYVRNDFREKYGINL